MSGDRIWRGLLIVALILSVFLAIRQVTKLAGVGKFHQPVRKVDLVCTACGFETIARVRKMPMKCSSCGKRTLVLAAYCPEDDVTLPLLDSNAYIADPIGAMRRYPEKVLPKCPKCGVLMLPKFYEKQMSAGP